MSANLSLLVTLGTENTVFPLLCRRDLDTCLAYLEKEPGKLRFCPGAFLFCLY